jgi:hypothetical protein
LSGHVQKIGYAVASFAFVDQLAASAASALRSTLRTAAFYLCGLCVFARHDHHATRKTGDLVLERMKTAKRRGEWHRIP